MNNLRIDTVVCWETRNWRHNQVAIKWCKDYGLNQIVKNVYLGKLTKREKEELLKKFRGLFHTKTEKFHILPLCKSCYDGVQLHEIDHKNLGYPQFEIT